jgi:hypothetical protein
MMSVEMKYALRPCAGVGFAGYFRNAPFKGIIRGDLVWCLAKPKCIDVYLSGIAGLSGGYKTPQWLPIGGSVDTFCGAQVTRRISVNLADLQTSSSLQPWLRLSGAVSANLPVTILPTEVAAIAYALYDPFNTKNLILITGIGGGAELSPPIAFKFLFAALGLDIKWTGELLLFFETLLDLSQGGDSSVKSYLSDVMRGLRSSKISSLYRRLK